MQATYTASEDKKYYGLTTEEAKTRLEKFGLNEIEKKETNYLKKIVKWTVSPISVMLFAAATLSLILGKTFDFCFIVFLAFLNIIIGFLHEKKADNAIQKLKESLSIRVEVKRNGKWHKINSNKLVPDDIIRMGIGNIVPADLNVLIAKNLSINESSLTGESLPKEKKQGDTCFAGSFISTGFTICKITATGKHTYFGKTLITVEKASKRSLLEKDILDISKFLAFLSIGAVIILSILFVLEHKPFPELLELDLSLIIAGIPVSLPTVMTLIISIGVIYLTKKNVITRKVSSLENLANVNLLLTDKTGTLTKNKINLIKVIPRSNFQEKDILEFAYIANSNAEGPIKDAISKKISETNIDIVNYKLADFTPYDSDRKRSTVEIKLEDGLQTISIGAPQVVLKFCKLSDKELTNEKKEIEKIAKNGYKALIVAVKHGKTEKDMTLAGIILFSDVLRTDAKEVIDFLKSQGIETKLITGDNQAISKRISEEMGFSGKVLNRQQVAALDFKSLSIKNFDNISTFSEILPLEKFKIVEFAKKYYIVAVTGDGVNDILPVETSDVGIAVSQAVDALKSTADIVITDNSIAAIKDAIVEARKIFSRLYSYAIYRISESFRVIFNILIISIIYHDFPLLPIQLIILTLLNDIPIVSLAFNRVKTPRKPAKSVSKKKFLLGTTFGIVGLINSLAFFIVALEVFHLDWGAIQTMFFLKLSVSGHLLIYVAHTKKRWYRYLPSKPVILTTTATQLVATGLAFFGILMPSISIELILIVWVWGLFWMQISEIMKIFEQRLERVFFKNNH